MIKPIITINFSYEQDIVELRQRARRLACLLGFDSHDQTRIATAVSEITRIAFQTAGRGRVQFAVEQEAQQCMTVTISGDGSGMASLGAILEGRYAPDDPVAQGLIAAKRLVDSLDIESASGGGKITLSQMLPRGIAAITNDGIKTIASELSQRDALNPLDEIKQQNQELTLALDEIRRREIEMQRLNQELAETNRGVMALYAELDERAGYLKRSSDLKSSFLSNMSHEFRTPLSSILSLARILLDWLDGELTEEQEKQVTLIRTSAQALAELVNDLLDIAKIEAGKTVVRPAEFSAADLLGALRSMFRPIISQTPVALIVEEPEGIPPLQSDESKVAQILRNLISNALKFTISGEVRVWARMLPNGRMVCFSVSDTGIGIEPTNHERVFDEFVQIEGSPVKSKGTGLGLPLSRRLARLLGGDVTVHSSFGAGATFTLTLPLVYVEPAADGVDGANASAEELRQHV